MSIAMSTSRRPLQPRSSGVIEASAHNVHCLSDGCRFAVLLLLGFCSLGRPQGPPLTAAEAVTNRYEFRQRHDPNGIGKFYMGRELAQVMGHEAATWLERAERNAQENTDLLVQQLKLPPGAVVADIGAGTGYYTRRLARQVLPGGKIFAVDIQPEMLALLTNTTAALRLTNVVPILGTATSPNLPDRSVDLVLMVDVYHEFDFPWEMIQAICQSLKPGGWVVFVEYRAEDPGVPIKFVHKMTQAQVIREMAVQPLTWVQTVNILPWQHIIIFRKRAEPGTPPRSPVTTGALGR